MRGLLLTLIIILSAAFPSCAAEWSDEQIEEMAARAEETVKKAYKVIWNFRLEHDMADNARDPNQTGMIGIEYSTLTTTLGYADAKYLSTREGWASWLVRELAKRGLWERADVAVCFSGSFPALNLAVLAALQELNSDVKGICSIGASSYGANETGLSWPEMERLLREEGVLKIGCSAVSLGGTGDHGAEWEDSHYEMEVAMQAVKRSGLPFLEVRNLRDAVKKRLRFYKDPSNYALFINVGGSQAVVGGGPAMRYTSGGWYFKPSKLRGNPDGVMDSFLKGKVPCLHYLQLEEMCVKYGILK